MLLLIRNRDLIKDREKTYLSTAAAAADTALTVRHTGLAPAGTSSDVWADNDYMVVGEIGDPTAEVMQMAAAVTSATSLTIDREGSSGGLRFAHPVGTPVYRIDYNRVEFSRSATNDSSLGSVLATNRIQPDDEYTRYEDINNTTGFGFVRWNNSTSSTFSAYSDGVGYAYVGGYPALALGRIMQDVRRYLSMQAGKDIDFIDDFDLMHEANKVQREVAHERVWPFLETTFSLSIVANQRRYALSASVVNSKAYNVLVDSQPLVYVDKQWYDTLNFDQVVTGDPTHCTVWGNAIWVWPLPTSAATSTTLNGATTATATSITLTSTSGFRAPGRALIGSEVISYENTSSTQLLGVRRGLEGTTAASHTDLTAITERDLVYNAPSEPDEMNTAGDETLIPNPNVLLYGVAKNLALTKLSDVGLHDRIKINFDEEMNKLRDNFGKKITASYLTIKNKEETFGSQGSLRNPNNFRELS